MLRDYHSTNGALTMLFVEQELVDVAWVTVDVEAQPLLQSLHAHHEVRVVVNCPTKRHACVCSIIPRVTCMYVYILVHDCMYNSVFGSLILYSHVRLD